MHIMTVAGLAQQLQIDGVIHTHIACALHQRFHNNSTGFVRVGLKQGFHMGEYGTAVPFPRHALFALKTIRGRRGKRLE